MSSAVVFQGNPSTMRSPSLSSEDEIFVILDSGSFAFGDSSIFLLVVLSAKTQMKNTWERDKELLKVNAKNKILTVKRAEP